MGESDGCSPGELGQQDIGQLDEAILDNTVGGWPYQGRNCRDVILWDVQSLHACLRKRESHRFHLSSVNLREDGTT